MTSLFTNVPLDGTIDFAIKTLFDDKQTNQTSNNSSKITFNDKMYKQTDGVAMGSSLGPVLANIFMGYCEDRFSKEHMPLF